MDGHIEDVKDDAIADPLNAQRADGLVLPRVYNVIEHWGTDEPAVVVEVELQVASRAVGSEVDPEHPRLIRDRLPLKFHHLWFL